MDLHTHTLGARAHTLNTRTRARAHTYTKIKIFYKKWFVWYEGFCLFLMYSALLACMLVHHTCVSPRSEEDARSLETRIIDIISCHVKCWEVNQVLYEKKKCSEPLSCVFCLSMKCLKEPNIKSLMGTRTHTHKIIKIYLKEPNATMHKAFKTILNEYGITNNFFLTHI